MRGKYIESNPLCKIVILSKPSRGLKRERARLMRGVAKDLKKLRDSSGFTLRMTGVNV